ncbi:MAG TPA: hypothetical protein VF174_03750 [Micromonosporaceae bacterium]
MTPPDPADHERSRDEPGHPAHPSGVPADGFEPWAFVAGTAPWNSGTERPARPGGPESGIPPRGEARDPGDATDDPQLWASAVDPLPIASLPPYPEPPASDRSSVPRVESRPDPVHPQPPPRPPGPPPAGPPHPPGPVGGPPGPGGPHPPQPPGGATPPYPPGPPLPPPRRGAQIAVILGIVAVLLLCCCIGAAVSLLAWGDNLYDRLERQVILLNGRST